MNKIDDILDEMDDVLDKSKPFLFGGGDKKVVNVERMRDLVDDVRLHMPSEIKEARGIVFDKERILNEAKEKADAIIRQAEKRAAALVMQDTIVQEAKKKALDILTQAKNSATRTISEATEYTNSIMNKTEKLMTAILQDVRNTKNSMREKR